MLLVAGLSKLIDGDHGSRLVYDLKVIILMPFVYVLKQVHVFVVFFQELSDVVGIIKRNQSLPVLSASLRRVCRQLHLERVNETLKSVLSGLESLYLRK